MSVIGLPVGALIGRYEVVQLIGAGGTAAVYEARDIDTGAQVALKLLKEELVGETRHREAFLAEARAAAGVAHPGVVRIREFGELGPGGLGTGAFESAAAPLRPWVAMELIRGATLAQHVRDHGPLSVNDALELVDALLGAVGAVHRAGLVHRDITPANVMVGVRLAGGPGGPGEPGEPGGPAEPGERGDRVEPGAAGAADGTAAFDAAEVRLFDFGLAAAPGNPAIVKQGQVWGSAKYLSPEQALGAPVYAEGDVYQVGAVLYFALTGRPPFVRDTVEEVLRAHVGEPLDPPSTHRPDLPARVDRLICRALRKNPAERFASAEQMRAAASEVRDAIRENLVVTAELAVVAQASASTGAMTAGSAAAGGGPRAARRLGPGVALTAAVLAIVVGIGLAFAHLGEETAPQVRVSSAPAPTETPPPSEPTPAAAGTALVQVPNLVGLSLGEARATLMRAGLAIGQVVTSHGTAAADTVTAVAHAVGARVAAGTSISVTVASGLNLVPDLRGMSEAEAEAALAAAGFVGAPSPPATGGGQGQGGGYRVSATYPTADTATALGTQITYTLAAPTPSTETPVDPQEPANPDGGGDGGSNSGGTGGDDGSGTGGGGTPTPSPLPVA